MNAAAPRPAYRTRIDVLFAARAPRAVVLRRGPRTHYHLLAWDLDTDTFTPGQWMKGLVRLHDLSPSGDRLIYWAAQHHASAHWRTARQTDAGDYEPLASGGSFLDRARKRRPSRKLPRYLRGPGADGARPRENKGCWTAICKPPWFTALAIWPSWGHWTGGGIFRSDNEIVLLETDDGMTPISHTLVPSRVRILSPKQARLAPGFTGSAQNPRLTSSPRQTAVAAALLGAGARWVEWVHITDADDLLYARDGCIYRLSRWNGAAESNVLARAERLIDLSDERFALVRAPSEALRW